jgi:hypothetical protein
VPYRTPTKHCPNKPQFRGSFLFSTLPLLQLREGEKEEKSDSGGPSLAGGRFGVGEGEWPGIRCVDVYRLGSWSPRSRFRSPSTHDGGVRVCSSLFGGGACVCPGDVGEAEVLGNKIS